MKRKLVTVDAETLLATDEQDHVHCRRADPAGRQCLKRCRQNRQKLADAMAGLAGIAGTSRLGNPDYALRCAVSLFRRYAQANQRQAVRFDGRFKPGFHLSVTCGDPGTGLRGRNHQLLGGLSENKAGDYRHAQKVRDSKGNTGENRNVRQ